MDSDSIIQLTWTHGSKHPLIHCMTSMLRELLKEPFRSRMTHSLVSLLCGGICLHMYMCVPSSGGWCVCVRVYGYWWYPADFTIHICPYKEVCDVIE